MLISTMKQAVYDNTLDDILVIENGADGVYRTTTVPRENGKPMIISFWAKASASTPIRIDIYGHENLLQLTTNWERFEFAMEDPSNVDTIDFVPFTNATIYIYKCMVEIATKASDWRPAPEDTDEETAKAQASADLAQDTADKARADILTQAEELKRAWTEINQTKTDVTARITRNDLETYLRYSVQSGQGTVEIGQNTSKYLARVSPEGGFQVIYEGTEMSSMKKNTVSAPVVSPGRLIQMGDNSIKMSAIDGGLIFN